MSYVNLYENSALQDLPDCALRPGGFDLTRRLVEVSGLEPGARILDVGCGYGASAAYLAGLGFETAGADKSATLVERGRARHSGVMLTCAAAELLPFCDDSFDAVLMECSLSVFLPDAEAALLETGRIVKEGGSLLVSDVFAGGDGLYSSRIAVRTQMEFEQILRKCGFMLTHFEDKTDVFEAFVAQIIMSTGSMSTLFDCAEWTELKKARPRYCIAVARRGG